MDSDQATSATPRVPADLSGRDPALTLAGLLDVLDRADGDAGAMARRRPRTHRSAAARSAAYRAGASRAGAVRSAPLRSVPPAPMARRAAAPAPAAGTLPASAAPAGAYPWQAPADASPSLPGTSAPGRWHRFIRRVALWGADGEHLAWRVPEARPTGRSAVPGSAVRRLSRRLALWGAGAHGENLAWGGPARRPSRREVDPPVVLREMPSTPTIKPAAPSPAAALLAGDRPAAGPRPGPPEPSAWSPARTGWPPPRAWPPSGPARARGDPSSCPARGSPPPEPRSRPSTHSASTWSPAPPSLPPPRPAPSAPG
jgi:hypothetical protein